MAGLREWSPRVMENTAVFGLPSAVVGAVFILNAIALSLIWLRRNERRRGRACARTVVPSQRPWRAPKHRCQEA